MTKRQKMLIKWWLILLALFVVVWVFQDNALVANGAFAPVALYAVLNTSELRELERKRPTPLDVIRAHKGVRLWVIGSLTIEITAALFFLASGRDLGEYIVGFGALLLAVIAPLLPPILISQLALFRNLANEDPR